MKNEIELFQKSELNFEKRNWTVSKIRTGLWQNGTELFQKSELNCEKSELTCEKRN